MTFYNDDRRWRQKREAILRRDKYQDQLEKRAGRIVQADTVHHILPIEQYPQYRWSDWNLISLSRASHEALHNRYTGELTAEGKRLMQELAHKRGIPMSELTMIVGGKEASEWARMHIGDGIGYDLDAIAKAFRLGKDSEHQGARRLARDLFKSFCHSARAYSSKVYIVRAQTSAEELADIEPDRVILLQANKDIEEWCRYNGITTEDIPPQNEE